MTYIVSGATGWMGRSALEVLGKSIRDEDTLIGIARNSGSLTLETGRKIPLVNYKSALTIQSVNGFIHTAFPTQNLIHEMGSKEYEFSCAHIMGWLQNFLDLARPKKIIGISSGVLSESAISNPRSIGDLSLYAKWKQIEESLLSESKSHNVIIGRLFSASGRFMTKPEKLALGDFILSGLREKTITVKSNVFSIRNYVDGEDFIKTLIYAWNCHERLTLDSDGVEISVTDLAKKVGEFFPTCKVDCGVKNVSKIDSYVPERLSPYRSLSISAGVELCGIDEQISRTILGLRRYIASK